MSREWLFAACILYRTLCVCVCTTLPPLENARALLTTGLDKFSSSPSRPTKGGKVYIYNGAVTQTLPVATRISL